MAETREAWCWAKTEPELLSLYEYIDLKGNGCCSPESWVLTGIIAIPLAVAFVFGLVLLKSHHLKIHDAPWLFFGPMGVGSLLALIGGSVYWFTAKPEERDRRRRSWSCQTYFSKLMMARWHGGIKQKVGEEAALALNAAAYDYLRSRSALRSEAWKGVRGDNVWGAAHERAYAAIDSAMAELVTIVCQGASASKPEVSRLVADLHQTAEEIVSTSQKLSLTKGLSMNVSQDLRQVLGEMRALGEAHDELMNPNQVL